MHEQPRRADAAKLERVIVLELLGREHGGGCSQAELASLTGATPAQLELALVRLQQLGVLTSTQLEVSASPAALHLDELGLISI